jgi:DNA helicase II / ATP-dependent DNA helicase PcrA
MARLLQPRTHQPSGVGWQFTLARPGRGAAHSPQGNDRTDGTLSEAMPLAGGESWSVGLDGDALLMAASAAARIKTLSGPGTGKTYVTMRRMQRLLEEGVDPGRILAVTLTRTAAEDLKRWVGRLGVEGVDGVVARTLHSHCFSILSRNHVLKATRVVPRILAGFETALMLRDLEGDFGDLDERRRTLRLFAAAWSDGAEGHAPGEPVEDLDQRFQDELIRWLRWHRGMLLEELVPQALRYLRLDPLAPERGEFEHVLVDEYQDLNRADQAVVELLAEKGSLSVVGDDDQSIYGFRFAFPEGIREFVADDEVQFVECRRCPAAVVRLANALVGRNVDRSKADREPLAGSPEGEIHHVRFATAEEEAEAIAEFIDDRISARRVEAGDCLVLVNSRRHGRRIRAALVHRGVPAESFFREEALDIEAAREVLTLLTLRLDPADRVALRAWLGFDSPDGRTKAYRRLWTTADEAGTDVSEVLERVRMGETRSLTRIGSWPDGSS